VAARIIDLLSSWCSLLSIYYCSETVNTRRVYLSGKFLKLIMHFIQLSIVHFTSTLCPSYTPVQGGKWTSEGSHVNVYNMNMFKQGRVFTVSEQ